jgi:hypothetical protein
MLDGNVTDVLTDGSKKRMSDLTPYIPKNTQTVQAIYDHYKKVGDAEAPRGYLGASIIGHPCSRYLWYNFRHCCRPDIDGRAYRLFETGDLAEARFVANLRAIGCTVHEIDKRTGEQFSVSAIGGHFSGHMDGCALGVPEAPKTWHVIEFKTHNAKSFAKLKSGGTIDGVHYDGVQGAKPQHYAQMQVYMGLTEMTRALYLAVNKDTDELYSERIHFDKLYFSGLIERARNIITNNEPPARISDREDYYECSWCDAHAICWGSPDLPAFPVLNVSCRQCCYSTPMMDGMARWQCDRHERSLSEQDQAAACENHICLPAFFPQCSPVSCSKEVNTTWLTYEDNNTKLQWSNGQTGFTSQELTKIPYSVVSNRLVNSAKETLGAEVIQCSKDDILSRYPVEETRTSDRFPAAMLRAVWQQKYGEDVTQLTPIAACQEIEYRAAVMPGGRVVIEWLTGDNCKIGASNCEIREGVQ